MKHYIFPYQLTRETANEFFDFLALNEKEDLTIHMSFRNGKDDYNLAKIIGEVLGKRRMETILRCKGHQNEILILISKLANIKVQVEQNSICFVSLLFTLKWVEIFPKDKAIISKYFNKRRMNKYEGLKALPIPAIHLHNFIKNVEILP